MAQRWILARAVGRDRAWEQQEQRQQQQRSDPWGAARWAGEEAPEYERRPGHAGKTPGGEQDPQARRGEV